MCSRAQRYKIWSLLTALSLLCFTSCSGSKKASEEKLKERCLKLASSSYPEATLQRLERSFFSDKQARGLLKLKDLELGSYREVNSSATMGTYELLFYFVNPRDEVVMLHNGPKTGGISLDQPNHISYQGVCQIKWSHFKGSAFLERFELKALSPKLVKHNIKNSKLKDKARVL